MARAPAAFADATRRRLLAALAALPFAGALARAQAAGPLVTVYKTATCGCCNDWVKHLRANGFRVEAHDVEDLGAVKRRFGIPRALASCHTARAGGYRIEGHVPAREIRRLLAERPEAAGLAVPGMPLGSPGMEAGRREPYAVLLFRADGRTSVYARYP